MKGQNSNWKSNLNSWTSNYRFTRITWWGLDDVCGSWSSHFVKWRMLTWLLEHTSSTADPMAQAIGFPPKVLKCKRRVARDLAISRGRKWKVDREWDLLICNLPSHHLNYIDFGVVLKIYFMASYPIHSSFSLQLRFAKTGFLFLFFYLKPTSLEEIRKYREADAMVKIYRSNMTRFL